MRVTERQIFVQDPTQIVIFDRDGKYFSRIQKVGHGPQEYISIHDFSYFNNSLYLLPVGKQEIMVFSLTGDYIRSMPLPLGIAQALVVAKDYKAFKYAANPKGTLIVADQRGKKSFQGVAPMLASSTFSISAPQPFTKVGDQVFYLPDFVPAVYTVGKTREDVRKIEFDFGSHTITPDYVAKLKQSNLFEQLKKDNVACFLNFHPTRDWWGLVFAMGDKQYRWFYNPKTGKQHILTSTDGSTSKLIVSSTDDQFVEAVDAAEFLQNPRYAAYRAGLKVDENDNAILIFYSIQ